MRAGLVDEMQIHVAPLLLGSGERLFEDNGVVSLIYKPTGASDTDPTVRKAQQPVGDA
jgi:dihydrofolate reductase